MYLLCTRLRAEGGGAHLAHWEGERVLADGFRWEVTGLKYNLLPSKRCAPPATFIIGTEALPAWLGFITQACLFFNIVFLIIVSIFERLCDTALGVTWFPMIDFMFREGLHFSF